MHGVISDKIVSSVFSEYFMLSEGQIPFSFDLLLMKLVTFGWWEIVPFFSLDSSLDFSIRHNIRAVQER